VLFSEMDKHVTIYDQFREGGGPVILINVFTVDPKEPTSCWLPGRMTPTT
jgi:hypothetical protein